MLERAKRMQELANEFRNGKDMSAKVFRSRLVAVLTQTEDTESTEWLAYALDNCELPVK